MEFLGKQDGLCVQNCFVHVQDERNDFPAREPPKQRKKEKEKETGQRTGVRLRQRIRSVLGEYREATRQCHREDQ